MFFVIYRPIFVIDSSHSTAGIAQKRAEVEPIIQKVSGTLDGPDQRFCLERPECWEGRPSFA
jgi:hypothetical protein